MATLVRFVGAVVGVLIAASCSVSSTTVEPVAQTGAEDAPTVQEQVCPYIEARLDPELVAGIASVLSGATLDSSSTDPCVKRFVTDSAWIELRFQAADDDIAMFGDETLMTNGVDTTRAETSTGLRIDVVATASSPQSISTWDASLVGASVAGSQ